MRMNKQTGTLHYTIMSIEEQVEQVLLTLAQDLFEMEVCAGDVGKDRENAVPDYLYVAHRRTAELIIGKRSTITL